MGPDRLNGLIVGGIDQHGYCLVDLLTDLLIVVLLFATHVPAKEDHLLGLAERPGRSQAVKAVRPLDYDGDGT